jgi:CRISPR-associated protein Cas6
VVDLSFAITGRLLPVDHAYALAEAVWAVLPWLRTEPNAGIHQIHVAESGNGWYRPDEASGQRLHLSRRTKMVLRLPKERLGQARRLVGATLDVGGCPLEVGKSSVRPLSTLPTLFARYVATPPESDEQQFLSHAAGLLEGEGCPVRKLVCGRAHVIRTPGGDILTRSLMVADLEVQASVKLQQQGLGPGRQLGCGLFLPHKGVGPQVSGD